MEKNIFKGIAFAIAVEFIYGCSYMFTKTATDNASVLSLLGWRFIVAAFASVICIVTGVMKVDLRGKNLKPLVIVAFINPVIYFVAETVGIDCTTASESGTFLACIPIVSVVASTLILKKKPSKKQLTGIIITLIGVVETVVAVGVSASFSLLGYLMLMVAVIAYSLYSVLVERGTDYTGTEITFIMILAGAIVFGSLAIIEALMKGNIMELVALPFVDMGFLSAILYQGILCSILAVFMSNEAIAIIGVNRISSFFGISIVVSILSGCIFLHESYSVVQVIGAVIIVSGVYVANMKDREIIETK